VRINLDLNECLNGYDNEFGSGLRPIGSVKRVCARRFADSLRQLAGPSGLAARC
jgi:hypothetical protein